MSQAVARRARSRKDEAARTGGATGAEEGEDEEVLEQFPKG